MTAVAFAVSGCGSHSKVAADPEHSVTTAGRLGTVDFTRDGLTLVEINGFVPPHSSYLLCVDVIRCAA